MKITFEYYKPKRRDMISILLSLLCFVSFTTQAGNKINSFDSVEDSYTNITAGSTIVLIANNGRYVSSENGKKPIIANRTRIGSWEKFIVVDAGNGKIALKGNNGKYLSSENGKKAMHCNVRHLGAWQKFKVIQLGNGKIALKGSNGKYVSSENGKKPMNCNRSRIGSWEKYKVKVLRNNNCELNAGRIESTQRNCGGFTPEEFVGTAVTSGDHRNVKYQWQIKENRGGQWQNITGANAVNYQPAYRESGSVWYRRAVKIEGCHDYYYSNIVDIHVKVAPKADVSVKNTNCGKQDGAITFTFGDTNGRTHIEFSLDGGNSYKTVPDDSSIFTFKNLASGSYDVWVRWGNDECPIDLGVVNIEDQSITVDAGEDVEVCEGEEVTLTASVEGNQDCNECVGYSILNTDNCKRNENYVMWLTDGHNPRWFSNVNLQWEEFVDGTAKLSGTVYDHTLEQKTYEVDALFTGKTVSTPADSPKDHVCNDEDSTGWTYYTGLTGTVKSTDGSWSVNLSRRGPAFQMGNGANQTETDAGKFGACGWFDTTDQEYCRGDFNINFGDCITTDEDNLTYLWSTGETTESITVNEAGSYSVTVKNCNDCEATDSVKVTYTKELEDGGQIEETQVNCEAFDPEEFTGNDLEDETGLTIVYQWQVKREQGQSWEDIDGANGINYTAPRIESGSLWYRRGAKSEECGDFVYSNSVDLHVRLAPVAEVILTNADCTDPTGDIELTFEDVEERTHIEFSIDGGVTYTEVPDDSGSFSFNDLEVGDYNLWVRWGNEDCPVDLGIFTIEEVEVITVDAGADEFICIGEEITLSAAVTGEGECESCVEYVIQNTDYCRGDHNFVAWINSGGKRRWLSNVDLVWSEFEDGTATLKGTMYDYYYSKTNYEVDVIYSGKTSIAPVESPKDHFCNNEDASDWVYYTELTGTISQVEGDEVFVVKRMGPAFQLGNGANTYETEIAKSGASGWFEIISDNGGIGDFNINFGDCITTETNGVEYLWSTGETTSSITVSPTENTTYSVTVSNCVDCITTDEVNVIVNEASVSLGVDINICGEEEVELNAGIADSYLWSTGETTQYITVTPTQETTYSVVVNQSGCEASDEVVISVTDISVDAGDDISIDQEEASEVSLTATASGDVESYLWSTGATTASIIVSPDVTTTYTVTVTKNGCVAEDNVTINVALDPCLSESFAATAFPIPVSRSGQMNVDIAVNRAQPVTCEIYRMDGTVVGPAVTESLDEGCNTITIDMSVQTNIQSMTNYILILKGDSSENTETIQFSTIN
ncbi:hypothetical protein [uncultured Aquimarina sp.]|uniref:hypothetical protein n=1 Tax=uncultured Aquimarina sp. TaxID=575652 RepID=UPI002629E4AA|nr:hypothetical protein [uncultured Aquimarina sp.]